MFNRRHFRNYKKTIFAIPSKGRKGRSPLTRRAGFHRRAPTRIELCSISALTNAYTCGGLSYSARLNTAPFLFVSALALPMAWLF